MAPAMPRLSSVPSSSGHCAAHTMVTMVSARGGKYGFVYPARQNVYRALRRKGYSKTKAARISNAGRSKLARKAMGHRAAAHRRARGK